MCRDTGYYEPRDDVSTKVVEEMAEKGNWSLENFEKINEQNRNSRENQAAISV